MSQFLGVLQTVGYLALAVFLLMLMITIHEFGHYISAKILKFKIYEFSIGMGKAIYKKTKSNGEIFAIRMIPVGGYCSFGEDNTEIPDDDPNSFNNKAPWKRLIVMFSGAFFNFISAIIFAVVLLALVGYGRAVNIGTVFSNAEHETDPSQPEEITLMEILEHQEGDTKLVDVHGEIFDLRYDDDVKMMIETINGKKMNVFTGSAKILEDTHVGDDLSLVISWTNPETQAVVRQNVTLQSVTTRQWNALCKAAYGVPAGDKIYHNFGGAVLKAVPFSFEIAGMIFKVFGQLITGKLGMNAIGGTVATVSVMGSSIGEALSYTPDMAIAQVFYLLTLISINLAVFNWLPIPSLDGARMVFVIIEWIRGKPINRELEAKIHMVGIICLLGFVIFADVFWIFNKLAVSLQL